MAIPYPRRATPPSKYANPDAEITELRRLNREYAGMLGRQDARAMVHALAWICISATVMVLGVMFFFVVLVIGWP